MTPLPTQVQDARATMKVYQLYKEKWERSLTLSKHSVSMHMIPAVTDLHSLLIFISPVLL